MSYRCSTRLVCRKTNVTSGSTWDHHGLQMLFRQFHFSAVIHLAAAGVSVEAQDFDELVEVNTVAAAALGRMALAHGIERFLYVGSGFEYRPQALAIDESAPLGAPNLYGASKSAGWLLLDALHRLDGLPLTTFRPFSIYGPGENAARLVPYVILQGLRREPIRLTLGSQVRDYIFIEDVVEALRLGLTAPAPFGKIYNIGTGPQEARSVRQLAEAILTITGAPMRLCWFDRADGGRRNPPYLVSDPTRAHIELGWRPRVRLEEGLERTCAWYKANAVTETACTG
jgi:nucleoside-diphosphate-sugar epimerase